MLSGRPHSRQYSISQGSLVRPRYCWLCTLAVLVVACFKPDDGREPLLDRIYFPTAAVLNPDGSRLYVANSDWDLQYNAGSLQVYDAQSLRAQLPTYCDTDADCEGSDFCPTESDDPSVVGHWCIADGQTDPCGSQGLQTVARRLLEPGLCKSLDSETEGLLLDSVGIGAFATTLEYRENPAGGGRLFIPVRSDATLHWIDVSADTDQPELDCGQDSGQGSQLVGHCDDNHRRGDDPNERSSRDESLPIEPFGLAASDDGQVIITSHQTAGSLGLFRNDWSDPEAGPVLQSVFEGLRFQEVLDIAAVPVPRAANVTTETADYQPGFMVSYRGRPVLQLIRYFDESLSATGVPFLEATTSLPLVASAGDIRSIAFDASARQQCEASCLDDQPECLKECARISLDVFFANRAPASLLVGNTLNIRQGEMPADVVRVSSKVVVNGTPSKVTLGNVLSEGGLSERRAFVLSFAASTISIVDPKTNRVEKVVFTGRGPSSIAIDEVRGLGYVTHFTDSYLGVVDLNREHATYGTMIFSLGTPTAPRGDG